MKHEELHSDFVILFYCPLEGQDCDSVDHFLLQLNMPLSVLLLKVFMIYYPGQNEKNDRS
jgi:hypothetical protein